MTSNRPIAIDLFCGLGGWTDGLLAAGYHVIGFDIEQHVYGDARYPAQLVIQDVLTLHGAQFRDAALIVASPPCQEYSYMAMPWTRAKAKAAAIRADTTGAALERLNRLFNACFRIQREASEAAGRPIPTVVENVRGAESWVGKARWAFGSYLLWGDVPALMPPIKPRSKKPGQDWNRFKDHGEPTPQWNEGGSGRKVPGFRFDGSGKSFQTASVNAHMAPPARVADREASDGRKSVGSGAAWFDQNISSLPSSSPRRKAASAQIAKIPFDLAHHVARVWWPQDSAA